jgi:hypothetical protein
MATPSDPEEPGAERKLLPRRVRRALFAALALLLAGALYLVAVRGEALLLDLAALRGSGRRAIGNRELRPPAHLLLTTPTPHCSHRPV